MNLETCPAGRFGVTSQQHGTGAYWGYWGYFIDAEARLLMFRFSLSFIRVSGALPAPGTALGVPSLLGCDLTVGVVVKAEN